MVRTFYSLFYFFAPLVPSSKPLLTRPLPRPLLQAQLTLTAALKEWETRNSKPAAEEKEIRLYGGLMFDGNTKRKFVNKLVRCHRSAPAPALSPLTAMPFPRPSSLFFLPGRLRCLPQGMRAPRPFHQPN